MIDFLPFLLDDENKHLRKAWAVFVLNLLRDKYKVNINAICENNNITRQVMYSYVKGVATPSHDNFANIYYDIVDLFEPLLEFELPTEKEELVSFLESLNV